MMQYIGIIRWENSTLGRDFHDSHCINNNIVEDRYIVILVSITVAQFQKQADQAGLAHFLIHQPELDTRP